MLVAVPVEHLSTSAGLFAKPWSGCSQQRKAAGGNDTMERVKFELLTPDMQDTEESNFSAQA
jgi:hypothetical protein